MLVPRHHPWLSSGCPVPLGDSVYLSHHTLSASPLASSPVTQHAGPKTPPMAELRLSSTFGRFRVPVPSHLVSQPSCFLSCHPACWSQDTTHGRAQLLQHLWVIPVPVPSHHVSQPSCFLPCHPACWSQDTTHGQAQILELSFSSASGPFQVPVPSCDVSQPSCLLSCHSACWSRTPPVAELSFSSTSGSFQVPVPSHHVSQPSCFLSCHPACWFQDAAMAELSFPGIFGPLQCLSHRILSASPQASSLMLPSMAARKAPPMAKLSFPSCSEGFQHLSVEALPSKYCP